MHVFVYEVATGTGTHYIWVGPPGIDLRCVCEQHIFPEDVNQESRKRLSCVFPNRDSFKDMRLSGTLGTIVFLFMPTQQAHVCLDLAIIITNMPKTIW